MLHLSKVKKLGIYLIALALISPAMLFANPFMDSNGDSGNGGGTTISPFKNEPGDVFATRADLFVTTTAGHLGMYIGDDKMIEMVNDRSANAYRRNAGAITNRNVIQSTPERFMRDTPMHEIRAIAKTGERLSDKVKVASVAKNILLAGATYHLIGQLAPASVTDACVPVFNAPGPNSNSSIFREDNRNRIQIGTQCRTIVVQGEYNCAQLVADALDRALGTGSFGYHTCGSWWNPFPCNWALSYLPNKIMGRIAALKISFP